MRRIPLAPFVSVAVALLAIAGLLLLMRQLAAPAAPSLPPAPAASPEAAAQITNPSPIPSPTRSAATSIPSLEATLPVEAESVVASVDGVLITRMVWQEATRLDGVMSQLAGQPIPSAEETLDQLINEILLVGESKSAAAAVAPAEVEARIASLESGWGLTDAQVTSALEAAGLDRQALSRRMARLITVEQAIKLLSAQHADLDAWLAQARQQAKIGLYRSLDAVSEASAAPPVPAATPASPASPANLPVAPQPQAVAPDFTLTALDGQPVRLNDLRGRPVLINFWATWCPACRSELPALQAAYQRYGERVALLGVDVKEPKETVAGFAQQSGLTFPILLDGDGAVSGQVYQVRGIPTSLFIAPNGVVSARHVGPLAEADIDRYLAPLLEEKEPEEAAAAPATVMAKLAPDFTLQSAQGVTVALSAYGGKSNVVLVFYRGQT
jgi:cytochrome c biogenesis protein CcmG/thiol:disulfide interchange protein DsbE